MSENPGVSKLYVLQAMMYNVFCLKKRPQQIIAVAVLMVLWQGIFAENGDKIHLTLQAKLKLKFPTSLYMGNWDKRRKNVTSLRSQPKEPKEPFLTVRTFKAKKCPFVSQFWRYVSKILCAYIERSGIDHRPQENWPVHRIHRQAVLRIGES